MEVLTLLGEQMSGQPDRFTVKWSPGEGKAKEDWR